MKPEWEVWWSGPRSRRECYGAAPLITEAKHLNGTVWENPNAGGIAKNTVTGGAQFIGSWILSDRPRKHQNILARLFSGVASFHVYGGGPQKHAPKDRRS